MRTIGGTQASLDGALFLEDRELKKFREKERARRIGLVLTDRTMAGGLPVRELVALGRQPHTGFFGRLGREDLRIVEEAIAAVGLEEKSEVYVAELSDGERQKAMIARAIAQECPVLLLDEPTAFLDVVSRIEILNLLHRLATEHGKTILLSTHDLEQALLLSDRLWLLSRERGLECGVVEDLVFSGALGRLFSRNGITFDAGSGSFRPEFPVGKTIAVQAEGTLLFWAKNALMRNGYLPAEEAPLRLEVKAPDQFCVTNGSTPLFQAASFEEFIRRLKSIPDSR